MISKYAPKRIKSLIPFENIKEELKLIKPTDDYYITPSGNVYRKYPNGYLLRQKYTNKRNGYNYITIIVDGKHRTYRLHRLVALAYIPNPDNLPIVGHKDNIKTNCHYTNLYWTINQENIQKSSQ